LIGDIPVIDGIMHPQNLAPENYATEFAEMLSNTLAFLIEDGTPDGYKLPASEIIRDWKLEESANVLFCESATDLAVIHVLPIFCFHDGMISYAKGLEAATRWPERFIVYAGVDPMRGDAIEELERQVETLDPVGVKLYPNSYSGNDIAGWKMNDREIAYPVFEKARALGINVIAVHKSLPLGPVALEHYRVDDVDQAAQDFPDMIFEVVHGGMAFVEETAWQIARYPNVFVNLETTSAFLGRKPKLFERAMAGLLSVGGAHVIDKIVWGTGAPAFHPRPLLEKFMDFSFSDQTLEGTGLPQIDLEAKIKILSTNYANMTGIDLDARMAAIAGDEFAQRRGDGLRDPWSTTDSAGALV
jgi:predicted TIM-barrel fold metal-dependent hydrolase